MWYAIRVKIITVSPLGRIKYSEQVRIETTCALDFVRIRVLCVVSFGMRGDACNPTTPPLLIVKWNKKHSSLTGMTTVLTVSTSNQFVGWLASRHSRYHSRSALSSLADQKQCVQLQLLNYDAFVSRTTSTHTYEKRFCTDTATPAILPR